MSLIGWFKGYCGHYIKVSIANCKEQYYTASFSPNGCQKSDANCTGKCWEVVYQKDQIGVIGFSAGGHLASTQATHFDEGNSAATDTIEKQSSRPDFAILVYPVISINKPIMHSGSRNNLIGSNPDIALARLYSNELQVTKNTPPTFLIHAMDDKVVPMENSLLFFQAMKDNGVTGELHVFPKGGHGFGLGLGKGEAAKWPDLCIDWLKSWSEK